jgi:CAAX prenyl protease-like protein
LTQGSAAFTLADSKNPPMSFLRKKCATSPEFARIAPFAIYAALTPLQEAEMFGPAARFWVYILKTLVAAWLVWEVRPFVEEMRWKISWEAVAVGAAIFAVWVGLDGLYPRLAKLDSGANPFQQFGRNSLIAWIYIVVHTAGMSLVVPPVEEIFYRSLVYRILVKTDFRAMPLNSTLFRSS